MVKTITKKHIDVARRVAGRFARGNMTGHFDDFFGVALLELAKMNAAGKDVSKMGYVYSDCRFAVIDYLNSRKSGRINGSFPKSLDWFDDNLTESDAGMSSDAVVFKSMQDFGGTFVTSVEPNHNTINPENRGKGSGCTRKNLTHCMRGHEFTKENTYIRTHKEIIRRECIACRAFNESRRRSKKMDA